MRGNLVGKEQLDNRTDSIKSDEQGSGLLARGREQAKSSGTNRSRSKSRRKSKFCTFCKKKSHFRKDCWQLQKKEKDGQDNDAGKQKLETADAGVAEQETYDFMLVTEDSKPKYKEQWILDSGCSYHMCPNRDWFTTYTPVAGGVVLMGNNATCSVVGSGTVRVRMHDGVIRTLSNVRHVPDLRKNLISLGVLDAHGYKIAIESGVIRISCGALVVMKGTKTGSLYVLHGLTVTGSATISSSLSESDSAKLWHMRLVEKQTGKPVKRLRTDNGLEFCGSDFNEFCLKEGIIRHRTVVGLGKDFWAEAVNLACYLVNRSPHRALGSKTPHEVWSGNPSDYSHLRVFGCPAYAHVKEGKLEPRAKKCIFLGYQSGVKGYRLYCPEARKFMISRDVTFDESAMLHSRKESSVSIDTGNESVSEKVEFELGSASKPKGTSLPRFGGVLLKKPETILARKMVKRGPRAATQVLDQWPGETEEEATWKYLCDLEKSNDAVRSYLFGIFAAFTHGTEDASPLGYLDSGYPQVVWSANRNHLVGTFAHLQLTAEGLVLVDVDGSVVWSVDTVGKAVSGLNMTDEGNLVLFDEGNGTIWQSFDHPTDSLVLGQKLKLGQKLVPSISVINRTANELISLSLTSRGLYAQMETSPLQIYYRVRFDFPNTVNESNYLQFQMGMLALFMNYSRDSTLFPTIPSSARFLRLDVDGHLRAYSWVTIQWAAVGDLLIRDYEDCGYPTVCGRYGICSSGGKCSCPHPVGGTRYFEQTVYRQSKLGCSEVAPLSCGASENQSFVEITGITYFTYSTDPESVPDATNVDPKSCQAACAKNCSCKAVFFQGSTRVGNGSCYYVSEVFSLIKSDLDNASTVYIKVQNALRLNNDIGQSPTSTPSMTDVSIQKLNHARIIVGFCLGSVFALIVVVAATILIPKRREQDVYEVEEDYLDQVPGMPTRFRYDDLKSITADFSNKLGQGGYGAVYHGILMDGTKVAVKRLNDLGQIKKSFLAEVKTIGSIHHVSLDALYMMKIAAWCLQGDSTKRPSMSVVVKVLDGGSEIPENLTYNFPFSSPEREICLRNGMFGTLSLQLSSGLSDPMQIF
ncbi:hypothetical protein MLD38_020041 [Melastoma candidum]|uniref:Uncharacterized protein n=1 Tax=Melastoma candidum TaxID=119954 RepID=A0ACB9QC79_9MYRT|nr:hypothetical protein MLD38_020041 [Melastoma candidum]